MYKSSKVYVWGEHVKLIGEVFTRGSKSGEVVALENITGDTTVDQLNHLILKWFGEVLKSDQLTLKSPVCLVSGKTKLYILDIVSKYNDKPGNSKPRPTFGFMAYQIDPQGDKFTFYSSDLGDLRARRPIDSHISKDDIARYFRKYFKRNDIIMQKLKEEYEARNALLNVVFTIDRLAI